MHSRSVKASQPKSSRTILPERLKNVRSSLYDDPAFSTDPMLHPYFVTSHSSHVNGMLPDPSHLKTGGEDYRGRPPHTSAVPAGSRTGSRNQTSFPLPRTSLDERTRPLGTSSTIATEHSSGSASTSTSYSSSSDYMRPSPTTHPLTDSNEELAGSYFANLTLHSKVRFQGNADPPLPYLPPRPAKSKQSSKHIASLPPPYTETPNDIPLHQSTGIEVPLNIYVPRASSSVSGATDPTSLVSSRTNRPFHSRHKKELDRIDELDETNPLGISLHHESPYEAVTRLVQPNCNTPRRGGTGGMYRNQHLTAPNVYAPTQSLAGFSLNLSPGEVLPRTSQFVELPEMDPHVNCAPTTDTYMGQPQANGYSAFASQWDAVPGNSKLYSPLSNPHIQRFDTEQYSEFNPYDPVNIEGSNLVQRDSKSRYNKEVETSVNPASIPAHSVSNSDYQYMASRTWTSANGGDIDRDSLQSQSVRRDPLGGAQQSTQTISTYNAMDNNSINVAHPVLISPGSAAARIPQGSRRPSLMDGHSVMRSIKSSSGSSQVSGSSGKPQSRYLPKKLVMPAPLQSSIMAPISNRSMSNQQRALEPIVEQRILMPARSDNGPLAKAQDIPISVSRKLRKRTTSTLISPADGSDKLREGVRFVDAPSVSISEGKLGHSVPVAAKKRVLSKKKINV